MKHMQSTYLLAEEFAALHDHKLYTKCLIPRTPRSDNLTAIIMHGAGEADSSRHTALAEQLR